MPGVYPPPYFGAKRLEVIENKGRSSQKEGQEAVSYTYYSSYGRLRATVRLKPDSPGDQRGIVVAGEQKVRADWEASVMPDFSNWIFINNCA
jgi:hypothetical protein